MAAVRLGRLAGIAAVLAALAAGAAPAGEDYDEACRLIRKKGDPKGLEMMEKVCRKQPGASKAFWNLALGYLSVKKDPAMAMDAAIRGLEQYDPKSGNKVPRWKLYDAFKTAAAKAGPKALRRYVPRIEGLVGRDAALVRTVLDKYPKYRTRLVLKELVPRARAAESGGRLGEALHLFQQAVEAVRLGGPKAGFEKDLAHGRELLAAARGEQEAALACVTEKRWPEAVTALQKLAKKYRGHLIGKQAQARFEEITSDPEIAAAAAEAHARKKEARAAELLAEARKLIAGKDYLKAIGVLKRAAGLAGTESGAAAGAELEKLSKDPERAAQIRDAEAEPECRRLLNMARNYAVNNMKDQARRYLDEVIKKHPGTRWAKEAARRKKKL